MSGSHWSAIFLPESGGGEYFDTYNLIHPLHLKYLKKMSGKKIIKSGRVIQQIQSNFCGHYCLFFLTCRMAGVSRTAFYNFFGENSWLNDMVVSQVHNMLEGVDARAHRAL